jgi:hypothetical protein
MPLLHPWSSGKNVLMFCYYPLHHVPVFIQHSFPPIVARLRAKLVQ